MEVESPSKEDDELLSLPPVEIVSQSSPTLVERGMSLNDEEPLPKRPCLAALPVEIVGQSSPIEKSTLSDVKREMSIDEEPLPKRPHLAAPPVEIVSQSSPVEKSTLVERGMSFDEEPLPKRPCLPEEIVSQSTPVEKSTLFDVKREMSLDEEPLPKRPRLAAPPVEIVSQSTPVEESTLFDVKREMSLDEEPLPKRPCLAAPPVEIVSQSSPVEKSTLFDVKRLDEAPLPKRPRLAAPPSPVEKSTFIERGMSLKDEEPLHDDFFLFKLPKMAVCSEVSSLRSAEESVVGCLEDADLRMFLDDSCALGAIPQGVKNDFASLDPEAVPRPLMVRYLLLHVYEWLEANPRLYERWLELLMKYVSGSVLQKVKGSYAGAVQVGERRPSQNDYLLEKDVCILTEVLAGHSAKWYQIGLSLRLPHNCLCKLISLIHIYGCEGCLNEVLREWIVGQHEHTRPPTVESLKRALGSCVVGLGDVSNQLDDQLSKHGMSLNDEEPLPKRPRLAAPPVEIVSQSRDIIVVEGKSTLLEVQVETRDQTNISYQWLKDGLPLEEGGEFIGVTRPILYLHATSLTSAIYICAVRFHDGADSVNSEPILVQISLPPLKKILVDRYCFQHEIPADSWPPQSSNTYINLALIKEGSINDAGEYARNTIQGNLDDVLNDKKSVEYEAVFSNLKSEARLLIEGRPGSGKTTLVHKFSQDWGKGDIWLESVELLFLVHLRAFFNDPDISLRIIIQHYYAKGSGHVDEIVKFAEDHSGEGLCFVLDGLDEYSPRSIDNTFIFQLIKGELLPKAVVIVASRPAATAKLRRIATKRVEVLGFLKEQIYRYVENYKFPTIENSKRADLKKYLDEHTNVRHMCYLPIHCAMVCFLFDIMGSCLPHTETEMYTEFTKHTLLRTLTRSGVDSLNSPEGLPSKEKEIFRQICKLGFKKTIASKQVMKKSELDFFMDLSSGSESLGLITVDRMASKCGFDNLYSFLHLTFQEYLAGYHISKLAEDEQLKIISKYGKSKCMYVVWKFFCGLVEFQESNVHIFDHILASKSKLLKGDLYSVQCAFESQQAISCDSVVRFGVCGTLYFVGVKTPSDFAAIFYVLTNSTAINTVVFERCDFSALETVFKDSVKVQTLKLIRYVGSLSILKCFLGMQTLEVIGNKNKVMISMNAIAEVLKHCPDLQTLHIEGCSITNHILADCSPDLKTLHLEGCMITENDLRVLAHYLKACHSLQTLNLASNKVCGYVLANCLKQFPNLQTLNLEDNWVSGNDAMVIAGDMKNCPSLQTLNLGRNRISDCGAMAIVDGLKHCPNLLTLNLGENWIGDDGARAVANVLKHCPDLRELKLDGNKSISNEGIKFLTNGLKHHPNLKLSC